MVRLPDAAGQIRNASIPTGPIKSVNPIKVIRGFFAGIGQLLLAADRFRAEEAERERAGDDDQHDPLTARDAQPAQRTRFRSLDSTGNVRVLTPAEAAEVSPEDGQPNLPVPGYDGLSLPSLRSRLRVLNAAQLRVLVDYEKSNAGREDVVTMFERRIAKLESAGSDAT